MPSWLHQSWIWVSSLLSGNPRLNLAFVANLFNTHPGLAPLEPNEKVDIEDFDAEGEREARAFTLWLNSLGVEPAVFNLFENLKNGVIILQAFDKIIPGSVIWRRVSKPKVVAGAPGSPPCAHGMMSCSAPSAPRSSRW